MQSHLLALALGAAIGLSSGLPSAALAQAPGGAQVVQAPGGAQLTGAPIGDWRGGPVADPNGKFVYCVAENRFDNKLALVFARNPNGETNILIGIPGAGMTQGTKFPMSVRVDETLRRNFTAVAMEPDLLVVPTGKDDELYEGMRKGSRLIMQGPTDTAIFQLRGTAKALGDLRSCVQQGVSGGGPKPGAQGGAKPVAVILPEGLRALLDAAGLRQAVPLSLANVPEDRRPADFAWRLGPVFGGVRGHRAPPDADFATLTTNYLDALKQRCGGEFNADPAAVETLPRVTLRTAMVTCTPPEGKINVAILFFKSQDNVFNVFFHEASDADVELARKARDGLTQVVRKLGSEQPPQAGQPAPPASPPAQN
ncbi:hypothetical protein JL100_002180 [Skermanella mucosa]|uniref:hypothetical protein n=1 Tax=Skermanella mucosa TaxID=1789672 RepID=UPI00192CB5EA|nr:hypothetical protein [Skermanella mucosa]UEM21603.1 hypothetical protein JL100_002180 [Skermanella mucosa]